MARHIDELSAILVKSLNSPGYYADGNGLYLQASAPGSQSSIFRFGNAGKRRETRLGPLQTISLGIPPEKAPVCRRLLAVGKDPIVERPEASTVWLQPATATLSALSARTTDLHAHFYATP